tara:strand:+ start:25 stop:2265 length:2241 start_codon:yes stop_codon:yes gene_type:complete
MVDLKDNPLGYKPANRKIQGLEQEKTVPIVNVPPKDSDGRNGDMLIVIENKGTPMLYFKANNSWFIASAEVKATTKKRYAPVGQINNPTSASVHDTGWFGVNDSSDATILRPNPGSYQIPHNLGSDLVTSSVFCRFEGLKDGVNHLYVVDLNSHISNSGPNSNRYGYWVSMEDKNTLNLNIHPDGLSIIYSDILSDTNNNTGTLISSSDSTNVGLIELRVFVYPVTDKNNRKVLMDTFKSDNAFKDSSKKRISTGNKSVNNLGATVDGTKNDSFSIDSDGTGVLLKNNSGILRVRNLADSSDADVQCSSIKDSNGKKVIDIAAAGSAVNFIKNTNSATTAAPSITPDGDDDNIGITVKPKGEGDVFLQSAGSNSHIQFLKSNSTVKAQFDVTSNTPEMKLLGDANNIGHIDTDVNGIFRLWNISDGSAGHLKISAKDTLYLNAGDGTIYFNTAGESTAGSFAEGTSRALFSFGTADKAILSSVTNDDMQIATLGSGNVELNPATGVTKFLNASDADDLCTVTVAASGATQISTTDSDGTEGHLVLKPNGILKCQAEDGGVSILETASAGTDTATFGQVWVKNSTPNELCFTDDAGTDITGIGKYIYDIQRVGYYSTTAGISYIPMTGYVIESTSTAGANEKIAFVAPYNGTLEKIMWRSEIAQNGTFRNTIYESTDGTEVPGSLTGRWDVAIDVADDTTVEFDYTATPTFGVNTLTKGRIYAFGIDPASAPNDTNATVVFKWDITS